MGLRKFLKMQPPKEDTYSENQFNLNELGISTKSSKQKREKFAAYGAYARDHTQDKFYAPAGYEVYARPQDLNAEEEEEFEDEETSERKKKNRLFKRNKNKTNGNTNTNMNTNAPATTNTKTNGTNPYDQSQNDPYSIGGGNSNNDPYSNDDPYSTGNNSGFYDSHPTAKNYGLPPSAMESKGNPYINNNISDYNGDYNRSRDFESSSYNGYNNRESSLDPQYGGSSNANKNPYGGSSSMDSPYSGLGMGKSENSLYSGLGMGKSESSPYSKVGMNNTNSNSRTNVQSRPVTSNGSNDSNPYNLASDTHDTYDRPNRISGLKQPNIDAGASNPYSRRRGVKPNKAPSMYSLDLNRSPLDDAQSTSGNISSLLYANKEGSKEFDFELAEEEQRNQEEEYDDDDDGIRGYGTSGNQMQLEQLEKSKTEVMNDVAIDEDLNATIEENVTSSYNDNNGYGNSYNTQLEEEEVLQDSYGYGNHLQQQKGYKTFDELQQEEQEREQQEEEEEVNEIKKEIKFLKQSSVASTRNTLRMAKEAEMSGMNTLGLLGHQSEKLHNIETNLNLMKAQNVVADDSVSQLKKLNRGLLAIHVSNPFNSKTRAREKEDKIKQRKMEEQLMRENANQDLNTSTKRIEDAMNGTDMNTLQGQYHRKQVLERNKKFLFEADEEDEEAELEMDRNLTATNQIVGRLKKQAMAMSSEVDSQDKRLRNIEEDTDNLDIKIHMNTVRLADIR
ncbi:hypothetical protein TBLA_0A08900 [Henningerozyma blattae CBS 6284]|uniref:t-SNARE coiled-coil homology domain-containing protein n=1 Tax=Henningerozyma blattae (strain ATCC 34711 / CBS 6284 / DSM 70876 / NBRC 10599 / NRRL Y-10934 / UCD 77-7) TaxID=1071380 RepID=I2GX27_HENB6|nr:hypothetical protein TBLA_0A08900 [Tetrapisispora blattae CBS 6284]CCH58679.1 hypothetical protein TBLA_0A08900 [Tetrapisispora blattae CBS 6284]